MLSLITPDPSEPTAAELAGIEFEWPLIAAEMNVLAAEISLIDAEDRGGPSPLDWRRLRRAEARVNRVLAELYTQVIERYGAA